MTFISIGLSFTTFLLIMTGHEPAWAQIPPQAHPVFVTPMPKEEPLGIRPDKALRGKVVTYDDPTGETTTDTPPSDPKPVGKIHVEGNKYHRTWAIKRHLKGIIKQQGNVLDADALEASIRHINRHNAFKLKAVIERGSDPNTSDIRLNVYERQPWQITGTFDNQAAPHYGYFRANAQLTNNNLLGLGDTLRVRYVGARDINGLYAQYELPVNRWGGNLGYRFVYNTHAPNLNNNASNFGQALMYIARFQQPIGKSRRLSANMGVVGGNVKVLRNGTRLAKVRPRFLFGGLNFNQPDRWGRTSVATLTTVASDWFDGSFKFWRGLRSRIVRAQRLPKKNLLLLKGNMQLASDPVSLDQTIQLGGAYTVRGYTENLFQGDRGYYFNVEHYWPIPFLNRISPALSRRIRGLTFFDAGQVFLDESSGRFVPGVSTQASRTLLMSAGVGVRYRLTQYLQGFADLAFPFMKRNATELKGTPNARLHFGIRSNLLPQTYKKQSDKRTTL